MSIKILYGTETGNSESLAHQTRDYLTANGYSADVLNMRDVSLDDLKKFTDVLVITSTWGEGEVPSNAQNLHAALKSQSGAIFSNLNYAVFAIGQSWYEKFCQAGIEFDTLLNALGAHRQIELEKCDDDYDQKLPLWLTQVSEKFKKA